jgi:hypothetical protein
MPQNVICSTTSLGRGLRRLNLHGFMGSDALGAHQPTQFPSPWTSGFCTPHALLYFTSSLNSKVNSSFVTILSKPLAHELFRVEASCMRKFETNRMSRSTRLLQVTHGRASVKRFCEFGEGDVALQRAQLGFVTILLESCELLHRMFTACHPAYRETKIHARCWN